MSSFKAYDIRGVYGRDFDADTVYRIGRHLPGLLKADRVLVGRDARISSPDIFQSLARGITDSGADVFDLGLATTPLVYFATATGGFPASAQITASHNAPEYNGLKLSRALAAPVGADSGLEELRRRVEKNEPAATVSPARGTVRPYEARSAYLEFLRGFKRDWSGLRFGIDGSNGMAGLLVPDLFGADAPFIYGDIDGTFSRHSPNPLAPGSADALIALVREQGLDIGMVFDGDADRVMFVDERGRFVRPDLITGLLAHHLIGRSPRGGGAAGPVVLHDIRTSRGVIEYLERIGARPHMWKVGHAFAKLKMREIDAVFGGELAGHYYFRDFFCCDSAMLAAVLALNEVACLKREGRTFSELLAEFDVYANSGEVNFVMPDAAKPLAVAALRKHFSRNETPLAIHTFDGERIEFQDWWYNVRPSNTEPYLRLVVECGTAEARERRMAEARDVLEPFGVTTQAHRL